MIEPTLAPAALNRCANTSSACCSLQTTTKLPLASIATSAPVVVTITPGRSDIGDVPTGTPVALMRRTPIKSGITTTPLPGGAIAADAAPPPNIVPDPFTTLPAVESAGPSATPEALKRWTNVAVFLPPHVTSSSPSAVMAASTLASGGNLEYRVVFA